MLRSTCQVEGPKGVWATNCVDWGTLWQLTAPTSHVFLVACWWEDQVLHWKDVWKNTLARIANYIANLNWCLLWDFMNHEEILKTMFFSTSDPQEKPLTIPLRWLIFTVRMIKRNYNTLFLSLCCRCCFFPWGPRLVHLEGDLLVAMNGPAQAVLSCPEMLLLLLLLLLLLFNPNKKQSAPQFQSFIMFLLLLPPNKTTSPSLQLIKHFSRSGWWFEPIWKFI